MRHGPLPPVHSTDPDPGKTVPGGDESDLVAPGGVRWGEIVSGISGQLLRLARC